MSEDIKFNTPPEKYLHEHYGNLGKFYNALAEGYSVKFAFYMALSKPDVVRLRMEGGFADLIHARHAASPEADMHDADVLRAIEFLEETVGNFPEDHPIWNNR